MKYNVIGGKYNRGLSVVSTLVYQNPYYTEEDLQGAIALGWAIEFLQAFFLVADDVMDKSENRRGQPCWYKLPDVQLHALNDYIILESMMYRIIRKLFKNTPHYIKLIELFQDVSYKTELGQLMDLRSLPPQENRVDLNRFSINLHSLIVKYKTAYYSFYLPWASGLIIAGVESEEIFKKTEEIAVEMGEYFQIQDDYLDCYGTPEQIGKIGRDIEEAKCAWLIVQALNKCNPEQRKALDENFGRDDAQAVAVVKNIYADLGITQLYRNYEVETTNALKVKIATVTEINPEVYLSLLRKIEGRDK